MNLGSCAVMGSAGDSDFELARQVGKFRVKGGPLADDFAVDAWVFDLVWSHSSKMIGSDVANAIATGLDGMHLYLGQISENIGRVLQLWPVVLDVLAGGKMTVALIVAAGDVR